MIKGKSKTKKGRRCPKCDGSGMEVVYDDTSLIPAVSQRRCDRCRGTGKTER